MKQLGNLAACCAKRNDVALQITDGIVSVHVGSGKDRKTLYANWNDCEKVSEIVRELNFGKYAEGAR